MQKCLIFHCRLWKPNSIVLPLVQTVKMIKVCLGDILHAFNILKQNYISIFRCIISMMALWNFPELEIVVLTW